MRRLLVAALVLVVTSLSGCHGQPKWFDEGPHPTIAVHEDSIRLYTTYGNYPANWTPWGHVTLAGDDHIVTDSSADRSRGMDVHKLDSDGAWRYVQSYRFGVLGNHGSLRFDEPGNYSLSDIDRGEPGAGIHVNVTVLTSSQGCAPSPLGRICDVYQDTNAG